MPAPRERKAESHSCSCGSHFEVSYFDDRQGDRTVLPNDLVDVDCPGCGRPKALSVPAGAGRSLVVEPVRGLVGHEEGGGD